LLNDEKISIHYVNAGHNPPLLIRKGKIIKLEKGGIILGVMKTLRPYISETLELKKDDVIIMFTDGISEAKSVNDEEFSDERLEKFVLGITDKSAAEIMAAIKNEVQKFTYGAVQSDDITLMIVKVK